MDNLCQKKRKSPKIATKRKKIMTLPNYMAIINKDKCAELNQFPLEKLRGGTKSISKAMLAV